MRTLLIKPLFQALEQSIVREQWTSRSRANGLLLAAALMCGCGDGHEGAVRTPITDSSRCDSCAVATRHDTILQFQQDWASDPPQRIIETAPHTYFVLPSINLLLSRPPASIIVVSTEKGLFERPLASFGAGPGEINSPIAMEIFLDTIYVFDSRSISVFNRRGVFFRSVRLAESLRMQTQVVVLPGNFFAILHRRGAPGRTAGTTEFRDSVGRVVAVNGPDPVANEKQALVIAPHRQDGIWLISLDHDSSGYTIDHVTETGVIARTLRRRAGWWRLESGQVKNTQRSRTFRYDLANSAASILPSDRDSIFQPPVEIVHAAQGDSILWVLVSHPRDPWGTVLRGSRYAEGVYHSRIDAIHIERGEVLASILVPGKAISVQSDGQATTYWQDSTGTAFVGVWRGERWR